VTRALLTLSLALLAGCGSGMDLYRVARVMTSDCEIRSNGEFCDDIGAQDPVFETFAVELSPDVTIVYFGEQAWIAQGTDDQRTSVKEDRVTSEPGPCTTINRRVLSFDVDAQEFIGTLETESRIEGNEACGETPRGRKQSFGLSGAVTNEI
jgi:hypothetical protein